MRILVVHNFYQQPGGEDQVFRDEAALLRQHGQDVSTLEFDNDAIAKMGAAGRVALARKTIWNADSYARIRQTCQSFRAEVVHFHNTFPLVSPAGYAAARDAGAAVVQTLHNYRLICPAATLFRQGGVCEQCVGRAVPWPGVAHKCYRGSRSATAVTAGMLAWHRMRGTYRNAVDRYIALTEFARSKLIEGGLPPAKLVVKPNFVPDLPEGSGSGDFVLFVGRLVLEKGIATLLSAWKLPKSGALSGLKLRIIGDGPLAEQVRAAAAENPQVVYDGRRSPQEVCDALGQARLLVFPSQWYEGLPRTIIEAYAKGTPVLASRLGSMIELVQEGRTGGLFQPGDPADLIRQASLLVDNVAGLVELRRGARAAFLARYTADQNYRMLQAVYDQAVRASPARSGSDSGSSPGSFPGSQPAV
jgi:glycosyltransferase involved in cell wall biosynthesis